MQKNLGKIFHYENCLTLKIRENYRTKSAIFQPNFPEQSDQSEHNDVEGGDVQLSQHDAHQAAEGY